MKNKFTTIIIIAVTVLLAGIAIFTSVRLYQLRSQSVVPSQPESEPRALENEETAPPLVETTPTTPSFGVGNNTPTTPTVGATCAPLTFTLATPTPTPTSTPAASCSQSCDTNSDCESDLICSSGMCRNPSCTGETDCVCPTSTPTTTATASPKPSATATAEPSLPQAGTTIPTIFGLSIGVILLLISAALAL